MNLTLEMIRVIGSPFENNNRWFYKRNLLSQIMDCANNNKIGLLFLETVKKFSALDEFEPVYQRERERYLKTLVTAQRVGQILEQAGVDYALYKTLKPFPITPNDVDVLLFGDKAEQDRAIETLNRAGFTTTGVAPLQTCLFDSRDGEHDGSPGKKGGVYFVDLYREASASYVIYLNKELLGTRSQLVKTPASTLPVRTLELEADLLATLAHSVFPEQLYTLNDYFTTLFSIAHMSEKENSSFVRLSQMNRVTYAVRSSLGITAELHKKVHAHVPRVLEETLASVGGPTREVSKFTSHSLSTPHRFSVPTVIKFFLERTLDVNGRRSITRQMSKMWKPRFVRYILQVALERRTRLTY